MFKNKSLMIVDDCESDRYLLKRILKRINFVDKIFEQKDGKYALELFSPISSIDYQSDKNFPPSLIFLDINMPLMDGFEFLAHFKRLREENDGYQPVTIVMLSSSEMEDEKKKAFSYDFVKGYIVKGKFSFDTIESEVKSALISDFDIAR